MNVKISSYARRLMELVTQEDLIDVCYKDLKEINDEINSDEELLKFITSADKSIDEKKARLQEIFENDLDEAVLHAFFLVLPSLVVFFICLNLSYVSTRVSFNLFFNRIRIVTLYKHLGNIILIALQI